MAEEKETTKIKQYLEEIISKYKTGKAQELTYRNVLEDLLLNIVNNIQVINEPKKQKCGKPDYIILKKEIPIGYIEAKDVCINLDDVENSEQLKRYRNSLENLILTNYLEFRFFVKGEKVDTLKIGELKNGTIITYENEYLNLINHVFNFCEYKGQTIKTSKLLADIMANKAIIIRDIILGLLENEPENSLHNSLDAFKQILLHDLTPNSFADMYAQTITYGLFVARINDSTPETFSINEARDLISKTNPFLKQLFYYILGEDFDTKLKYIVNDLVDVFLRSNVHKMINSITQNDNDPFLHFYETFLESYDKINRKKRGVYYTPLPIVRFIVNAVDEILKKDFGILGGLADYSQKEYESFIQSYKGKDTYDTYKTERVQILDPSTGTGTFLVEVIHKIYESYKNQKGMWTQYIDRYLFSRLNGFEIMMTPYVMCHLKLDLFLKSTGYEISENTSRFNVYLTNALEKGDSFKTPLLGYWLAKEVKEADKIKGTKPIMVILGNPPYARDSINKNSYINNLISVYKKGLNEQKINIDNDYIKFIRLAETYIENNKEGIVAYINSNSYLNGPTYRVMRKHLLKTFDKIYIINLHGHSNGKEKCPDGSKDENVFDIMEGVCINIFVKSSNKKEKSRVFYTDVYGLKKYKFNYLDNNCLTDIKFEEITYKSPYYLFEPLKTNFSKTDKFSISDLFKYKRNGIETQKNSVNIFLTENEANETRNYFINNSENDILKHFNIKNSRDWSVHEAKKDLLNNEVLTNKILFSPFDIRYTNYTGTTGGIMAYPRHDIMSYMLKDNVALCLMRTAKYSMDFSHVLVSKYPIEKNLYGYATFLFPLYEYVDDTMQKSLLSIKRKPNFNMEIIKKFETNLDIKFVAEKEENDQCFSPIDIFDYIYGILHSKKYRIKYKENLKIDFPFIPYPKYKEYFFKISNLGKQIRELHLLEVPPSDNLAIFNELGNDLIEKVEYINNDVHINKTQFFSNIPKDVWSFEIGGYTPAKKWLEDRKRKLLDFDSMIYYQKMIVAISKTIEIMEEIDKIIDL